MIEECIRDAQYAVRRLRRAKTFAIVVVAMLAAAITANATVLSILHALVLRPLPVPEPARLVAVARVDSAGRVRWMSTPLFEDIARRQQVFSGIAGYAGGLLLTLESEGVLTPATVEFVTGQYYATLGVTPALGRLIDEQDRPFAARPARVVILAHEFWQRQFNGDPGVVGRSLRVAGVPLTIVGVAARGFRGMQVEVAPSIAVPLGLLPVLADMPGADGPPDMNHLIARLKPGVSVPQAEAHMASVWKLVREAAGTPDPSARSQFEGMHLRVQQLDRGFSSARSRYADPLVVLAGTTALLLLLTCLNLAALFLARVANRRHTYEILIALGAGRWRIARAMSLEVLPLVILSVVLAIPAGRLLTGLVTSTLWGGLLPLTLLFNSDAWLIPGILGFLFVLAMLTAVAASALVRARGVSRERSGVPAYAWWSRPLVVAQIAVSLVLVFVGVLLAKSAARLAAVEDGVDSDRVLIAKLASRPGEPEGMPVDAYYQALLRALHALPSVDSAAVSHLFPWVTNEAPLLRPIIVRGRAGPAAGSTLVDMVSPEFFVTAGIPLLSGRSFTWSDNATAPPVAILNRSAASTLFADGPVLGQRLVLGKGPRRESVEIVGIVANATMGNLRSPDTPVVFRPSLQEPAYLAEPNLSIRTSGPPLSVAQLVRDEVSSHGRHYVLDARTLEARLQAGIARERVMADLSSLFAAIAVAVAISGLYAVIANAVARRTREIGVRMALGASREVVLRQVVREAVVLSTIAVISGLPAALLAGGMLEGLLFGASGHDASALVLTMLLFVLAGTLAGALPGGRAARLQPLAAILRSE